MVKMSREEQIVHYMQQPYAIKVLAYDCEGRACYMAVHTELEGCMAQGNTPAEAVQNLTEARRDYINALLDEGLEIPLPQSREAVVAEPGVIVSAVGGRPHTPVFEISLSNLIFVSTAKPQTVTLAS